MPLTFTLPAGLEAAVRAAAMSAGTTPEELVTRAVAERVPGVGAPHLDPAKTGVEAETEDDADDGFDFDEFARNVNANRGGGRLPYPPEMKGVTW
jgi:hypothetical protein